MPETASSPPTRGPYSLREYTFLSDGERGALMGPRGEIAWLCFPGWADEALFSSLLLGPGRYDLSPLEPHVWGGYYEPRSLIWHSRWTTPRSLVECREAMAYPGEPDRAVVLRRLTPVLGTTAMTLRLEPRAGFGKSAAEVVGRDDQGSWILRTGSHWLRWTGAAQAAIEDGGLSLALEARAGQDRDFVLEISGGPFREKAPDPKVLWETTRNAWFRAVPAMPRSASQRDAEHAFAVLQGLCAGTGAVVAAATTSLPERAEAERNFDYRYAWIRDQCYVGMAVAEAGDDALLDRVLGFVRDRLLADGPKLRPAYTVSGGGLPAERSVEVPGYPGGQQVMAGNRAGEEFQLDAFGESLLLFSEAAERGRLDAQGWAAALRAADAIAERWTEADSGIWELEQDHWTHSRLACVAGLRRIASQEAAPPNLANRWLALADAILARTSAEALHPAGHWQRTPRDDRVDAALLEAAIRGALPRTDPRTRRTLQAIVQDLSMDGFLFRYRANQRPLGEVEGAFLLCNFWASLAFLQQGDRSQAVRWFDRARTACGPSGLLTEEFDVAQRQLRGNLPQAFVHALLLETSLLLGPDGGSASTGEGGGRPAR